jgi:hypothetical protein
MIPLPLVRGDEWRLGPATLKQNGEPVPDPEAYAITGLIAWPGGSLQLTVGNGRVFFDAETGTWVFIVQEQDNRVVPLGRVARLTAAMVAPDAFTTTSQSVTLEIRQTP